MLEGWIRYYTKEHAEVVSAGVDAGKLNLIAAKAMIEAVIDITKHQPLQLSNLDKKEYNFIITLTHAARSEAEKHFPESRIIHKPVEHPLHEDDEDMEKLKKHRKTVNQLEEFALEFVHNHIRKLI